MTTSSNYRCKTMECEHGAQCQDRAVSSPLIRDVAKLAKHLAIDYIWIDSVCIIQGASGDFAAECNKMADYYQYAWMTIFAASTAPNGALLRQLNTSAAPPIARLPYRDQSHRPQGWFYLQGSKAGALYKSFYSRGPDDDFYNRGWIFQENLLSRRSLMFLDSGCFLKCKAAGGTIQSLDGEVVENKGIDVDRWDTTHQRKTQAEKISENWRSRYDGITSHWANDIARFSGLALTYLDKDRLFALAGVVREYDAMFRKLHAEEQRPNDQQAQYASGLWFPSNLLQWQQAEYHPKSRFRLKGFPTWSWASVGVKTDKGALSGLRIGYPQHAKAFDDQMLLKCTGVHLVPVREDNDWSPDFGSARLVQSTVDYDGQESRFAMLHLLGRLHRVCIGGFMDNDADVAAAISLTGWEDHNKVPWHSVKMSASSGHASGWASIERPSESGDDVVEGLDIYALHYYGIEIKPNVVISYMGGYRSPHRVLYLTPVYIEGYQRCFERVGAGMLFGDEMVRTFDITEETDLWLV